MKKFIFILLLVSNFVCFAMNNSDQTVTIPRKKIDIKNIPYKIDSEDKPLLEKLIEFANDGRLDDKESIDEALEELREWQQSPKERRKRCLRDVRGILCFCLCTTCPCWSVVGGVGLIYLLDNLFHVF